MTAGAPATREIAALFLKLGVIGFGGPAAHVAMMRDEVVRRRGWIDDEGFLEVVGATNLIPGPNSTELAIHLGHRRGGTRGLLVAGACFIGPAVLVVGALAWLYERFGTEPAVVDLRYGILPVVIAVVAHALVGLARVALRRAVPVAIAAAALGAYLLDVHELAILAAAGSISTLAALGARFRPDALTAVLLVPVVAAATLRRLFLVFLEIGSVLYGSGYVLLAFLQRHVVEEQGWLTSEQLLDAVAVGQVTPGPVFSTATFVGWQVDGAAGAAVATVAIFLPSFAFVAALGPIVAWTRRAPLARAFLTGVTAASLGLMGGVLVELTDTAVVDVPTALLALGALAVFVATRVGSAWLVGAGALVGVVHAVVS